MASYSSQGVNMGHDLDGDKFRLLEAIEEPAAAANFRESKENEKQILVDPISLRGSSSRDEMFVPVISAPKATDLHLPPPLPPTQFKFVSSSLPNSANSSPQFTTALLRKKAARTESLEKSSAIPNQQQQVVFQRSKSCVQGRDSAPPDYLDIWLNKPNVEQVIDNRNDSSRVPIGDWRKSRNTGGSPDQKFKCGALCLFFPGFGRVKPVRSRPRAEPETDQSAISSTASLEKFECGSWASSAIVRGSGADTENSSSHYFDLPMELIRNSVDTYQPMSAAFVFDREPVEKAGAKSSLGRTGTARGLFQPSSASASPASCNISPRLRRAREYFNAYLEAQST